MEYNYQYLVISLSEERKNVIQQQYKDLKLKAPLHFLLNPSSLSNSSSYLPQDMDDTIIQKVICCARSHIRALEFACRDESPEFTIIFEDDAALHKCQFENIVQEIIQNWNTLIYPNKMASIGWLPMQNYENYTLLDSTYRPLKCIPHSKFFDCIVYGMQAYIIRKCDILPLIKHLVHPTFIEMRDHINSMKFSNLPANYEMHACDGFINRILGQTILFPPACIEQHATSIIGHDTWNHTIWDNFFENYTCMKSNYYTFD